MLVIATVLFVLFVVLMPMLLSSRRARDLALRWVQPHLHAKVDLDGLDFSWGRGLSLRGLRIGNPPGFGPGPVLAVARCEVGLSFSALLRGGGIKAQAFVDAPHLRLQRLADGRTNVAELLGLEVKQEPEPPKPPKGGQKRRVDVGGRFEAQIRFVLRGGRVEVVDEQTNLTQAIEDLEITLDNQTMGGPLTLSVDGRLVSADPALSGSILTTAKFDPAREQPLEYCTLRTTGLDLGAVAPVLAAFLPDVRFESLRGRVAGELQVRPLAIGEVIDVGGQLTVEGLDVRGGPFGPGRGLVVPRGSLRPGLRYDLARRTALLTDTDLDLGFLGLKAQRPEAARALLGLDEETPVLGCTLRIDLARLAAQPGLLPKGTWVGQAEIELAAVAGDLGSGELPFAVRARGLDLVLPPEMLPQGLRLAGPATLDLSAAGRLAEGGAPEPTLQSLVGSGKLLAPKASYLGNDLESLALDLELRAGRLSVTTPPGAKLNGGPITARIDVEDLASPQPRVLFDLDWAGGKAEYGLTPLLQYAVPILAGLPTGQIDSLTSIDFRSTAGLKFKGGGSWSKAPGALLEALAGWSATGELRLANGSFTPGEAMKALFQLLGQGDQVAFDDLVTSVRVEDGRVHTSGFRMGGKSGTVSIEGSTSLRGDLDFRVDLTDALSRHRDGQRVLAVLGKAAVVPVGGTLTSPRVQVDSLLEQGAQGALRGLLEGLQKGKDPGKALRDLLKGR